jgi:thiol-disulfide isomerase/thioredoxin
MIAACSALAQNARLGTFVGKPAPNFVMTDTSGKKLTNKSLLGKVVVLDFWATWCGPCKAASPAMQKLHSQLGSQGVMVIGANCFERGNSATAAKAYAAEHKYTYRFTSNNDGLAESFGIQGIPAFVIIDKKGVVRFTATGLPPSGPDAIYSDFKAKISGLLK